VFNKDLLKKFEEIKTQREKIIGYIKRPLSFFYSVTKQDDRSKRLLIKEAQEET
jgi:hypothetical protein